MMRGVSKRIGSIKFACLSPDEIRKDVRDQDHHRRHVRR